MATKTKNKQVISRIERFILDKLSTNRFNKIRAWLQRNVQRYDKYLLARHLEEKTQKLIERDDSGLASFKAGVLANQAKHIMSQSQVDITKDYNEPIDTLAVASKIVDELYNLNDLVGLQPMEAPVGLIYQLRYKKQDEPVVSEIKSDELSLANSFVVQKHSLQIISQPVEAVTRRLKTGYAVEALRDVTTMHGLDIASELIKAIGSEIAYEYTTEVLSDLIKLGEIPLHEVSPSEADATKAVEVPAAKFTDIIVEINKAAAEIAHKTRRGMGNVIVCSPIMLSILQSDQRLKFEMDSSGKFNGPTSLMYVGTLDGRYRVYSSLLPQFENKVLVAFKGKSGQVDTGYILSPYIPVLSLGMTIDGESYQPMQRFGTRYGKTVVTKIEDSDGGSFGLSQNYYRTIDATSFIEAFTASGT